MFSLNGDSEWWFKVVNNTNSQCNEFRYLEVYYSTFELSVQRNMNLGLFFPISSWRYCILGKFQNVFPNILQGNGKFRENGKREKERNGWLHTSLSSRFVSLFKVRASMGPFRMTTISELRLAKAKFGIASFVFCVTSSMLVAIREFRLKLAERLGRRYVDG